MFNLYINTILTVTGLTESEAAAIVSALQGTAHVQAIRNPKR